MLVAHGTTGDLRRLEEMKISTFAARLRLRPIAPAHAHAPYNEPDRPPPVHVTFLDWLPGICSLLGMVVVNLIDKDRVQGNEDFGDSRAVWRARLFLFIGFALMAGGLAGSVVRHHYLSSSAAWDADQVLRFL